MPPSIQRIKGSDGTGNANKATIQNARSPLASTIIVDTVLGINPDGFIGTMGTPHTFQDPVTGEDITVISEETAVDFSGHVDGGNLEIDEIAPGYTDEGSEAGDIVIIRPTTQYADNLAEILEESHEDDGKLKTAAVQEALNISSSGAAGWLPTGEAPDTVTYNGNRSYACVFNSLDLTSTLSPGMRLMIQRTVAAPTRSASLNGTNQYYSKATPAGMAQTDNISVGGWLKPSVYQTGHILVKSATPGTDGYRFYLESSGQPHINGNGRYSNIIQSLPLYEWSHVVMTLSMATNTVTAYLNGIQVSSTSLSGAGASFTNAGNLFLGSNPAATQPFAGNMAQMFVASKVLSAAEVKALYSQGITPGLITSHQIVSAYSFDNSIADLNTTNANDLVANGGVVATNADSPFGNQADGSIDSELDYGIIQAVSLAGGNTTLIVQVPEGCTIPTSGGVDSVSYSTAKAPYGMPIQKTKWQIITNLFQSLDLPDTASAWYSGSPVGNEGLFAITAPIGSWLAEYNVNHYSDQGATTNSEHKVTLHTAKTSPPNSNLFEWGTFQKVGNGNGLTFHGSQHFRKGVINVNAATPYYILAYTTTSANNQFSFGGQSTIMLENAYL